MVFSKVSLWLSFQENVTPRVTELSPPTPPRDDGHLCVLVQTPRENVLAPPLRSTPAKTRQNSSSHLSRGIQASIVRTLHSGIPGTVPDNKIVPSVFQVLSLPGLYPLKNFVRQRVVGMAGF